MNKIVLQATDLKKSFDDGKNEIHILKNINLSVDAGKSIAIVGKSGSGKSTLLHILGGLAEPSSGEVIIDGKNFYELNEKKRCQVRNEYLGFVYQFHHLLPEFTALENVMIPMILKNVSLSKAKKKAQDLLNRVGLSKRLEHRLAELSGGERQRVAIARALANQPACLLADEPTGNLDDNTSKEVFDLLLELKEKFNTSLIIATHDMQLAKRTDSIMQLHEGSLESTVTD